MGELAVARAPGSLEIRGLGSCIALALYDPLQRVAGLAHIVIPRPLPNTPPAPAWAATAAVPALLSQMEAEGCRSTRIVARLAGGASMFRGPLKGFDVGRENARIVAELLEQRAIPILTRQLGGHSGRHVRLDAADGRLQVRVNTAPSRPIARVGEDPGEMARILLEATAAPLSDLLQRPIVVESTGLHELDGQEIIAFLGPDTAMIWGRIAYRRDGTEQALTALLPEEHARAIDSELRATLADEVPEGAAMEEALNIMLSHAVTAHAKLSTRACRPIIVRSGRARTRDILQVLPRSFGGDHRVAHARLHVEGAFQGADLALIGADVPELHPGKTDPT